MATWQDGPEYAPLERPDEFAEPAAAPLEVAPPPPQPGAAQPVERPAFTGPAEPVAPLASLVPAPRDERDPGQPFAVVTTMVTGGWAAESASPFPSTPHQDASPAGRPGPFPLVSAPVPYGAAPFPGAPGPGSTASPVGTDAYGQPTYGGDPSASFPASPYPTYPPAPFPSAGSAHPPAGPVPSGFPAPGTPEWFAPAPYGEQPAADPLGPQEVLEAATPGLLICLFVGAVLPPLSPVLLVVAFLLSRRVRVAQSQVRRAHAIGLGAVGTFALIGLLSAPLDFSDWWSPLGLWSLLCCWVLLVTTPLTVYRRLRSRRPGPPAPPVYRGPWG